MEDSFRYFFVGFLGVRLPSERLSNEWEQDGTLENKSYLTNSFEVLGYQCARYLNSTGCKFKIFPLESWKRNRRYWPTEIQYRIAIAWSKHQMFSAAYSSTHIPRTRQPREYVWLWVSSRFRRLCHAPKHRNKYTVERKQCIGVTSRKCRETAPRSKKRKNCPKTLAICKDFWQNQFVSPKNYRICFQQPS